MPLGPRDERSDLLARRAAQRLGAAGRHALERDDVAAAVRLLERATALRSREDTERPAVLLVLADALGSSGDAERRTTVLREAVSSAEEVANRRVELRARLELDVDRLFIEGGGGHDAAEAFRGYADELARQGDHEGVARAWFLAGASVNLAEPPRGREEFSRSLEAARRAGDRRGEVGAIAWLVLVIAQGSLLAQQARRECRRFLSEAHLENHARAGTEDPLGWLEAICGDFDEARRICGDSITVFDELGMRPSASHSRSWAGLVELLARDYPAAESHLRLALGSHVEQQFQAGMRFDAALLAEVLYQQERYREAEDLVETESRAEGGTPEDRARLGSVAAKLAARRGDRREAESLVLEALALADTAWPLEVRGDVRLDLAEVLLLDGRPKEAAVAAEEALRIFEKRGNVPSAARARERLRDLA